MIKNVIFDWSGTLVDDFYHAHQTVNQIFTQNGKPPFTEEEFRDAFFLPFMDFVKKYLPKLTLAKLDRHFRLSYQLLHHRMKLLPHALKILKHCHSRKIPIFLLSSIHNGYYEHQSKKLGIQKYFKQAYVDVNDKRKIILKILADYNLDPRETLFVGDMQHDIEAARHGCVQSCAVLTGYDTLEKLKKSKPDHLYRDLGGVLNMLKKQTAKPEYYPIPTVGAIIYNKQGKILMIRTHKWSNLWGMPGGKIKANETALDAIHREIREETSLKIHDVKFAMLQDCIRPDEFYRPAHFLLLCYLALTDSAKVKLNEEADEFKWLTIEQAFKLPLNKPTKKLLEAIDKGLSKRAYR